MEQSEVFAALRGIVRSELLECQEAIQRDDKLRALTELNEALRKIRQLIDKMI